MTYVYPSAEELLNQMETLPRQRFSFLLKHVVGNEDGMDAKELVRSDVLMLGLADWMYSMKALTDDDQQRILMEFKHCFVSFGCEYALPSIKRGRPVAQLGILDFQFVTIQPEFNKTSRGLARPAFFGLEEDKWVAELPHHALTRLYCDLGTLLTRLESRIVRTRQLEPKDGKQQHITG